MTGSLLDFDVEIDVERIEKPVKAWRNWYKATATDCTEDGLPVENGEVFPGLSPHPSKDLAESVALRDMAWNRDNATRWIPEYLGAFPEGTRP